MSEQPVVGLARRVELRRPQQLQVVPHPFIFFAEQIVVIFWFQDDCSTLVFFTGVTTSVTFS